MSSFGYISMLSSSKAFKDVLKQVPLLNVLLKLLILRPKAGIPF